MSTAYQIAAGQLYTATAPEQDAAYRRFVRGHRCIVCGAYRPIETAHTGPKGLGQKSSDRNVIPLCVQHHRTGAGSLHALGPVRFEERHRLVIAEIRAQLNAEYEELLARRIVRGVR